MLAKKTQQQLKKTAMRRLAGMYSCIKTLSMMHAEDGSVWNYIDLCLCIQQQGHHHQSQSEDVQRRADQSSRPAVSSYRRTWTSPLQNSSAAVHRYRLHRSRCCSVLGAIFLYISSSFSRTYFSVTLP